MCYTHLKRSKIAAMSRGIFISSRDRFSMTALQENFVKSQGASTDYGALARYKVDGTDRNKPKPTWKWPKPSTSKIIGSSLSRACIFQKDSYQSTRIAFEDVQRLMNH